MILICGGSNICAGSSQVDGAGEHCGSAIQQRQRRVVVWGAVLGNLLAGREAVPGHDGGGGRQCCASRVSAATADTMSNPDVSVIGLLAS